MPASPYLAAFAFLARHRTWMLILFLAVTAGAGAGLLSARFDNTLDMMLPERSPAKRMILFLRDATFANKVVIAIENRDPQRDLADAIASADRLAAALRPPLITRVITGFTPSDAAEDVAFFMRHAPQIVDTNDLAWIDRQLTPEGIDRALRQRYLQLLKPEGVFVAPAIRSDPLDINQRIIARMQALSTSMGYNVKLVDGHFVSADGRHVMLIAETPVAITDVGRARQLLDYLRQQLRLLPPFLTADLICGHAHTVSNEDAIKKDLGLIMSIASAAFVLLYIAFFRDVRGLLIFLIPAVGAVIGLFLTSLLFDSLAYMVVGFGCVIAGIADDYGIAVYTAVRYGRDTAQAVRHIARPVTVGAATTSAIFFAFFFSSVPGYHQLAWFATLSIFISLAVAVFLLPHFLRAAGPSPAGALPAGDAPWRVPPRHSLLRTVAFACVMLLSLAAATRIRFDSNVTRLDGTDRTILAAEDKFRQVWGGNEQQGATLAVAGLDREQVLAANDAIYRQAIARCGAEHLASFASLWPARSTRAANAQRWAAFWKDGRENRLRQILQERGAAAGFAGDAFTPFFEHLYDDKEAVADPAANKLFGQIQDRFVQQNSNGVQVLTFLADEPKIIAALTEITRDDPRVFLVSRRALSATLSESFGGEVVRTSAIAVVLILVIALVFLRSIALTCIAMVPAVTAVAVLLGALAVLGIPLNIANMISGIVVFGLSIDFGIHILHAWQHQSGRATRAAVTLAAVTTILGAGALLFARHPALFSIGLTLVIGVGAGYVAAMWVVPALCEVCRLPLHKEGA